MRLMTLLCVTLGAAMLCAGRQNGAGLDGYKTLDICAVSNATWRYSGVISVWNSGDTDTIGFNIADFVEYKAGGSDWTEAFDINVAFSGEIPAGGTEETARTFPYSIDAPAVGGAIRNNLKLSIMNHSGHLGVPFGPNPKISYSGTIPPPACPTDMGCTYTQGYWGNKPGVVWPAPYDRNSTFFLSGETWQQAMDTPVNVSQGYYQLAHQYIAAVLNHANGAYVPSGVQDTLNLATAWLSSTYPSACTGGGSCGLQKDWAATLDLYNNGLYPSGPGHCGEE